MSRINVMLTGALVVQLAFALLTWTVGVSASGDSGRQALFDFGADDVRSLVVEGEPPDGGGPAPRVELAKAGDEWIVASAGDFPAESAKVDKVLEKLTALKIGKPIASNAVNHNSLRVGERDYGRKLTIKTGSGERSLVLGDGPRSSLHVRDDGEPEVYSARGMAIWELHSDARSYVPIKYVEVESKDLTTVNVSNTHGSLSFARAGDEWALAELPPGETLNQRAAKNFTNAASRLYLQEPLTKGVAPEYGFDDGVEVVLVTVSVGDDAGEEGQASEVSEPQVVRYKIGAARDDKSYYAKAENNDHVVIVAKSSVDQLVNKKASDFVEKQDEGE